MFAHTKTTIEEQEGPILATLSRRNAGLCSGSLRG